MEFTFTKRNLQGVLFVRKNEENMMEYEVYTPEKSKRSIGKRLKTGDLSDKTRVCK